jgi:hypothetical protein
MEQNKIKPFQWDTLTSTYYWYIELDPNHAQNSVPGLTGYSKVVNQNEAQDKDNLLKRKIVTLFNNSYLLRAKKIEFYQRSGDYIDKKRDPKILILYRDNYDIPELNHDIIFKKFGAFLKEFYYRLENRKSMEGILPKQKNLSTNLDDLFNVDKYNFPSLAHLYAKASNFSRHGHAPGLIDDFVRKYRTLKNW